MDAILKLLRVAAQADRVGLTVTRIGLVVVLVWSGRLKVSRYEADGIVPFVANSPVMSFFYADAGNYKAHTNPEGAVVPANRAWHEANRTYPFALGLGSVIVLYGLLVALNPWLPQVPAVGSFLVTAPECWVPDRGGPEHGFPLPSGAGWLVVKDAIMLGAALVTMRRFRESVPAHARGVSAGGGPGGRGLTRCADDARSHRASRPASTIPAWRGRAGPARHPDPLMDLTLQTPALLFPAVSLLLLAYTNRFLALATLVRSLEGHYRQSHEGKLLDQIRNLKRRLRLIRNMQLAGVLSLFCCTGAMFLLFFGRVGVAEPVFSVGLVLMMASLGISAEEIRISVRALDLHLTDLGEQREAGTGS